VRYAGKKIFELLFQLMGSHLGKFEAAWLLRGWAEALTEHYPATGKSLDTIIDDYLLSVAETCGSVREAARFILKRYGNIAGGTEEAVVAKIERLQKARKINSHK
jgi:hypothetical protein